MSQVQRIKDHKLPKLSEAKLLSMIRKDAQGKFDRAKAEHYEEPISEVERWR